MDLKLLLLLAVFHTVTAWDQCFNDQLCDKINHMKLDVDQTDNDISLTWSYNSTTMFYGFQVKIFDSDDAAIFESPILHISSRNMDFEVELPSGKSYICLQVLNNSTHTVERDCEDIKVSDLKIIVGILAGTIFLIPCLVILAVFMYKDKQIRKSDYQKLSYGNYNDSFVDTEDSKAIAKPSGTKQIVVHQPMLVVTTEKKHVNAHNIKEIIMEAPNTNPMETQETAELKTDSILVQKTVELKADSPVELKTDSPVELETEEEEMKPTVEEEKAHIETGLNIEKKTEEADVDSAIEQQKIDETIPNQEPEVNEETTADDDDCSAYTIRL